MDTIFAAPERLVARVIDADLPARAAAHDWLIGRVQRSPIAGRNLFGSVRVFVRQDGTTVLGWE